MASTLSSVITVTLSFAGGFGAAVFSHYLTQFRGDREYLLRRLDELFRQHDQYSHLLRGALIVAYGGADCDADSIGGWKAECLKRVNAVRDATELVAGINSAVYILFRNLEPAFFAFDRMRRDIIVKLLEIEDYVRPVTFADMALGPDAARDAISKMTQLEQMQETCLRLLDRLQTVDEDVEKQIREEANAIRRGAFWNWNFER